MRFYKLKKNYITPSGDVYYGGDREYTDYELPAGAKVDSFSTFREVDMIPVEVKVLDRSARVEVVDENNTLVRVQQNSTIIEEVIKPSFKEAPITPVVKDIRINVNSATASDLESLKFVGKATATRIIEARVSGLFKSIEELDAQIPLAVGRSWVDLAESVRFN